MKSLNLLKQYLQEELLTHPGIYNTVIPDVWDIHDANVDKIVVGDGHLIVNPYEFMIETIDQIANETQLRHMNFAQPYYSMHPLDVSLSDGNWIKQSVIYSSMIRTSTSYDSDRSGKLDDANMYHLKETGTFLKTLLILPMIKKMGVDTLYLLPITEYSKRDKKGDLGSPYGVTNFFELDDSLKDPLTGDKSSVELEFKALVEACHILGIKVVIDIIPRTNSINSDYIAQHPDWFYWIKKEEKKSYHPPLVPSLKTTLPPHKRHFNDLFASEDVINHLKKFVINPKESDPIKWEKMMTTVDETTDVLGLIEDTFGCSVAFAFSDHINDAQPAWSDVTYFRMYLDHPENSKPYLDKLDFKPAPYILYDVAKCSLNPGTIINEELWELISSVIPHFQTTYGIDGARIDMGHALPKELVSLIINKARDIDPNFCFIAEEMDIDNAAISIEKGYNIIIGDGFMKLPRIDEGKFNDFVYGMGDVAAPVFAAAETHDTPRLAARPGGKTTAKMVTLFNYFIPNTTPFINSGQEFYELAPMNTGLDVNPEEPYMGKLALFDYFSFNMTGRDRFELLELCEQVVAIRNEYMDALMDKSRIYPLTFEGPWVRSAAFAYENEKTLLIAMVNTNFYHDETHRVFGLRLPERFKSNVTIKEVFASVEKHDTNYAFDDQQSLWIPFKTGEVKLLEISLAY